MKINGIYVSLDNFGNVYLSVNKHDDICYQICIDAKNRIYLDYYSFNVINKNLLADKKFMIEQNNLKKKIQKNVDDVKNEEDYDEDDDPDVIFPETVDVMFENSDPESDDIFEDDDYDPHESTFVIYSNKNDTNVVAIEERDCYINSLYDTYIYDSTKLVTISKSFFSGYVLKINSNGILSFRQVGCREYNVRIVLRDGKIILE